MPDWLAIIGLILVAALIARIFLGTLGLGSKLDQINERTLLAADAIARIVREEVRALGEDNEKLRKEVVKLRNEVVDLKAEVSTVMR